MVHRPDKSNAVCCGTAHIACWCAGPYFPFLKSATPFQPALSRTSAPPFLRQPSPPNPANPFPDHSFPLCRL
eukprot:464832-Rhodomonas_salina.1